MGGIFPRGDLPPGPFSPSFPIPILRPRRERRDIIGRNRCASATLNGFRCARHVLYALTVCAAHAQYFVTRLCFPPGGTTSPYLPDEADIHPNASIGHSLPEMRRALTPAPHTLIAQVNRLLTPPQIPKLNSRPFFLNLKHHAGNVTQ